MIGKYQIIDKNDINMKIMTSFIYYELFSHAINSFGFRLPGGVQFNNFLFFFFRLFSAHWYPYVDATMFIRQKKNLFVL